jgi:two-component system sensor histidine kinase DegS
VVDAVTIESIISETLDAIKKAQTQIYDIAEGIRTEYSRITKELDNIKGDIAALIATVDAAEKEEKMSRLDLIKVSKDFSRYKEQDIKSAYQKAQAMQLKVQDLRYQEQLLRYQRHQLEMNRRRLESMIKKAEDMVSHLSVVLNYLTNDLRTMGVRLAELEQMHQLGISIIRAQEEERKRVAREIHDGPAQIMANIVMRAEFCLKLMEMNPGKVKEELMALQDLVRRSLQDVRKIIFDLRPMVLDDLGLVPALKRYLEDFRDEQNIAAEFLFFGQQRRLNSAVEVALFRVIQESLNNIRKHSSASRVVVKMEILPERVNALIQDNGVGFDSTSILASQNGEGFGLVGIRERIHLLQGTVDIVSQPGRGCKISLSVPANN